MSKYRKLFLRDVKNYKCRNIGQVYVFHLFTLIKVNEISFMKKTNSQFIK